MIEYDYRWATERNKEKWKHIKIIIDFLDFIYTSIKLYWMYGVVMIIGLVAMIKYMDTIPKDVSMLEGFFQGELIFLFIGVMMPLVFGFGLRQGRRI